MTHETRSDHPLPFEIKTDIEHGTYSVVRIPPGWKFERNGSVDQLHNGESYYSIFFGRDMGSHRGTAMILLQEPISDVRIVNKATVHPESVDLWFSKVLSAEIGRAPPAVDSPCDAVDGPCVELAEQISLDTFEIQGRSVMLMARDPDDEQVAFKIKFCPFCAASIQNVDFEKFHHPRV